MIPRSLIVALVAIGVFLPLTVCVLLGVEGLLSAMSDELGAQVVGRIRLAMLVLWIVDLAGLLLALGVNQLASSGRDQDRRP